MSEDSPVEAARINKVLGVPIKPDWEAWKSVKQAKLWEAAALACDLDPGNFLLNGEPVFRYMGKLPQPVEELLDMAKGSLGAGGILKTVSNSKHGWRESEVRLSNFATWINSVPHKLPAEFPWNPEPITFSNLNWPWGRHETDLLRRLAAAAHEFWDNYDPNEPTTAPKNDQVISWLEQQGVSQHIAKVMATILRADGLPTRTKK